MRLICYPFFKHYGEILIIYSSGGVIYCHKISCRNVQHNGFEKGKFPEKQDWEQSEGIIRKTAIRSGILLLNALLRIQLGGLYTKAPILMNTYQSY